MAAQGEEAWYVARTKLHQLLQTQPQYTNEQYATACQMSLSWVKRWKKLLKAHPNSSEKEVATLLQGKPPTPKTKPKPLDPFLVERILYHRQQQANLLNRPPGPRTLVFYLNQDNEVKERGLSVPGTTTIWQVLVRYGCIPRPHYEKAQPRSLNEPMQHWQADFKDSSVQSLDPDGKKQHFIEVFNIVDTGTSILVDARARTDYNASTVITTLAQILQQWGLPQSLTFSL